MRKPTKLYTQTKDDCWRISICNLLNLKPDKVPHFVKEYGNDFVTETRKWLNQRGMTLVYVTFSEFLETGMKYNNGLYPEGKCIARLGCKDGEKEHACLMIDGQFYQKHSETYDTVLGYFIVYFL